MISPIIKQSPFIKCSATQLFHDLTKNVSFETALDTQIQNWPKEWSQIFYKTYPRFERLILPTPSKLNLQPINFSLMERVSIRTFTNKPFTLNDFSTLIYYSLGKKNFKENKRFYPSAGARYPIEAYPIVFNIKGVKPGVYHYHVLKHSLEFLWSIKKDTILKCFNQDWLVNVPVLLVLTSVFWRTEMKYNRRGYRYVMLDCGHMCQNIYLVATALNLGCCSIGGFLDDELNQLLDIDGVEESAIVVLAVGNK